MSKLDVLMTGVGGQGIILSSDVMGEAAIAAGFDVKKTDVHGMAQRGGSVTSHVRIGRKVASPLINEGEVDVLLGFEKLEGVRWTSYLKPGGIAIVNNHALPPLCVALGQERYPADQNITGILKQRAGRLFIVPATKLAMGLGDVRTLNMVMIGCVSHFAPFTVETWRNAITQLIPAKIRDINLAAFEDGRREIERAGL